MFEAEAQYLTMIMISGKVPGVLCPHVLEALIAGEEEIMKVDQKYQFDVQDWIWWRNHVVAPFSEEFTFRACMVPVLLGEFKPVLYSMYTLQSFLTK